MPGGQVVWLAGGQAYQLPAGCVSTQLSLSLTQRDGSICTVGVHGEGTIVEAPDFTFWSVGGFTVAVAVLGLPMAVRWVVGRFTRGGRIYGGAD